MEYLNCMYCKTLNICGMKILQFNGDDIFAHFNFGVHDVPWFQIGKKLM